MRGRSTLATTHSGVVAQRILSLTAIMYLSILNIQSKGKVGLLENLPSLLQHFVAFSQAQVYLQKLPLMKRHV